MTSLELPLRTDRLLLRAHRADDLDDLTRFHGDPEVVRYVPWPVRDREATERALRAKLDQASWASPGQALVLAVEVAATGTVIGEVLLKWVSDTDRQAEVGFAFRRDHWGQGYAAEAVSEVLRLAFDDLDLHRVTAVCIEGNSASARLLQRLGFSFEGRFVDHVFFKGEWATQLFFGLTAPLWREGVASPDAAEIRRVIDTFFAAFTSGEGVDERLDALRVVLLPSAVVTRTCGMPPEVYDVESFIAPRRTMLLDGTLVDFSEHASAGRVEVFGDIAHWFGRYEKDGLLRGQPAPGEGMKSVQLVRTSEGWRISAAAWDDVRPGVARSDHRQVVT
jgi:RimJ/RimL family protein N-acetyltransferase